MPDERAAAAIRARVGHDWSVLDDLAVLAKTQERQLRRILRSHREVGFTPDDAELIRLRRRLDDTLDRLMLVELGIETGILDESDLPPGDSLPTLLTSSAFSRYLNAYLYFSVRFVASRVLGPRALSVPVGEGNEVREQTEINELPVALPCPPRIESGREVDGEVPVENFLKASAPERNGADHVQTALDFLDDFVTIPGEQAEYELWLRGLSSIPEDDPHFTSLTRGLIEFARTKAEFYIGLEGEDRLAAWRNMDFERDAWTAKHPLTARFGILDLYWLARLLRAEVSSKGIVSYGRESWLALLEAWAPKGSDEARMVAPIDDVLRSVFDYTCDLVQNAVEIASDALERSVDTEASPTWPAETVDWRAAYDEELEEITRQRKERRFDDDTKFAERGTAPRDQNGQQWSRRVRTGEHVEDLIGLAFSGGGIRSATFNLGVLQRLQELDLLREIDYLSTVSGGGYIGAWLLGNVRRTHYWLSQLTDWGPSIEHLRKFSNYLAPRTGLMSADTWTMWGSWVRNALLIQVTAAVWLALLLVFTRVFKALFASDLFNTLAYFPANSVLAPSLVLLTYSIFKNLRWQLRSSTERKVHALAVLPAWAGSFLTAAMLWASRSGARSEYSQVLGTAWEIWFWPLALLFGSFWILSWVSMDSPKGWRVLSGALPAAASIGVVYLGLCGVYWLFGQWSADPERYVWFAYAAGPPMVLFAMTLAVVMIIGLIGHDSPDWRREWWTRFGAWLGIYGVGFLGLSITSVFGPYFTLWLAQQQWQSIKWGTVIGWVATVAAGLFTGNSERTNGDEKGGLLSKVMGWFTKIAAVVFIVGAALIGSTGVHALLVRVWTEHALFDEYFATLNAIGTWHHVVTLFVLLIVGLAFSWRFEINIFGLNQFYRNRLVRCYLGATRWRPGLRNTHKFTGFDADDDLPLSVFRHRAWADVPYGGPFPIVNCSLNLGGSSDLGIHSRRSASFVLTPMRSGAHRKEVGYAPSCATSEDSAPVFAGGVQLGQAISVSGAAASPNMGYHTSPLVAFLLTMFNVRLAWWFPNPGRKYWSARWLRFSLWYLVKEMFALADERNLFVNVSDGGHFENLGIYELVRRRCKVIIACDAECDTKLAFGSLGSVVRMCETDFGATIDIDIESIRRQKESGTSRAHCAVGRITYGNGSRGCLIYLKSSISGDEDIGIEQYLAAHPEFPHESTGDQFFAEDQFEAYRRLGHHVASLTFRDVRGERDLLAMARKLADLWIPSAVGSASFVDQTESLDAIWERFRATPSLYPLLHELTSDRQSPSQRPPTEEEFCLCLELFQHMENVFLALRLDDFWAHPDHRGWAAMFRMWAKSPTFRASWTRSRDLFGSRFVHFCHQRLGI
ncbi:MAG TPA: patatin-like phospholipase family protein [Vicinamibacterales bacterium]|nr:patatin-like phospholipase family protein [Vicinamibacterales bacterium]